MDRLSLAFLKLRPLTGAWLQLCALTVASTVASFFSGRAAMALLVVFAFCKARIILGDYLHLSAAPGWLNAASLVLGLWLGLIWVLYAV